jgi:MHS family proline/betaine transporter-like MFS transporter
MFACIVGGIGVYFMRESAGRNLLGSMPVVDEEHEVTEVLESLETNEKYDLDTMPIEGAEAVGAQV